jgi:thymidylate synthase
MNTDKEYISIIRNIYEYGDELETRNYRVKSIINCNQIVFTETPLVTIRKVAWKKAIKEMSWFLSGNSLCPDELRDWWDGQLNREGRYIGGYGDQLRSFSEDHMVDRGFDQVRYLLEGLRDHKNSRRLVISTWNAKDMSEITSYNDNPKTPTNCHGSIIQCHVRDGKLPTSSSLQLAR